MPITRTNPTAFIVLIDQSGSMRERIVFAGEQMTKARAVTLVASGFIDELIHRARREGGPRDYYHIAALGYSGEGVESLLSPTGEFTTPGRLAAMSVKRERIARERVLPTGRSVMAVREQNIWLPERAGGATPMREALEQASKLTARWCACHAGSYPPTVINITDGEGSDGDVRGAAEAIRATGTDDGRTILMNNHLMQAQGEAVLFPSSEEELPDHRYARLLWEISSAMPAGFNDSIRALGGGGCGPFRAMGWGCHIGSVAAMMNIGSINSLVI